MIKLIKHSDGRVIRLFRCECGTPVYKKDLANGTYEFMARPDRGVNRMITVKTEGKCEISCPNPQCSISHIVLDFKEGVSMVESFKTTVV